MATLIVMAIFLAFLVAIGVLSKKYIAGAQDFLLAGRELSLPINVFGVVATGFAGTTLALAPGFAIRFGFWGTFMFAFGYAILGICLYGLFFSKTIRRSGTYTLPEWLEIRYNRNVRILLSIAALIALIAVTANNVLALANVLTGFFGWSLYISIAVGVFTFLLFTYFSGMWAVSLTDFVQAMIGLVGCPIIIIACISQFGPVGDAITAWGGGKFDFFQTGISGLTLPGASITYPSTVTLALLFSVFLVFGGQHYWIRMASTRSESDARNSYIIGGIILFFITMIIGTVGVYGGALFPEAFNIAGGKLPPEAGYGFVVKKFSLVVGSFLMIFALAASLSTCAGTLVAAVSVAIKDVYQRFINKQASQSQLTKASRYATIIISLLTWLLAYYPQGTVFLFAFAVAWCAPAGILLILGIFWRRGTAAGAFAGAVCGVGFMSIWAIMDFFKIALMGRPVASYVHISVVGLIACIVPMILVSLFTKPKYYGAADWKVKAEDYKKS